MPTAARAASGSETKARVITAATALFAARGLRGTSVRDIAARAGVNLAAAHYHFGSKEDLYLEVLRVEFEAVHRALTRRGVRVPGDRRLTRRARAALLRARIGAMLELMLGPPFGLPGTLLMREMCDPSPALPHIVARFIAPLKREMEAIVAGLVPQVEPAAVERCVFSIVGQVFFYRTHWPALRQLSDGLTIDRPTLVTIADHIAAFSLAGLERLGRLPRRPAAR